MVNQVKDPLVSIVIATYNRAAFLPLTLGSACSQSENRIEIIVVDDASDDDTGAVVSGFTDSRLSYHRLPRNLGMIEAFGHGLRLARGEFVVFLNDDDRLRPEFVRNRLRYLEGRTDRIVVFSPYDVRDRDGNLVSVRSEEFAVETHFDYLGLLAAALSRQWFIGSSMYRRDPLLSVWPTLPQEEFFLDFPLHIRLAISRLGGGVYIPNNDFVWTSHPGQVSHTKADLITGRVIATLQWFLRERMPAAYSSLLRSELALTHILLGRQLAARCLVADARSHFREAIKASPWLFEPWKQLGVSLLWPGRLVASSRRQWGTESVSESGNSNPAAVTTGDFRY